MTKDALTISQIQEAGGPCRTKTYDLISSGKLKAKKDGRRTLILREDWRAYLDSLPEFPSQTDKSTSDDGTES
jgi:hypothetical protein